MSVFSKLIFSGIKANFGIIHGFVISIAIMMAGIKVMYPFAFTLDPIYIHILLLFIYTSIHQISIHSLPFRVIKLLEDSCRLVHIFFIFFIIMSLSSICCLCGLINLQIECLAFDYLVISNDRDRVELYLILRSFDGLIENHLR